MAYNTRDYWDFGLVHCPVFYKLENIFYILRALFPRYLGLLELFYIRVGGDDSWRKGDKHGMKMKGGVGQKEKTKFAVDKSKSKE